MLRCELNLPTADLLAELEVDVMSQMAKLAT